MANRESATENGLGGGVAALLERRINARAGDRPAGSIHHRSLEGAARFEVDDPQIGVRP
jgi:hypothetical protein